MSIAHLSELPTGSHSSVAARCIDPATWADAGLPTLLDPRSLVDELHRIHLPQPGATVLGLIGGEGRLVAGASFAVPERISDGWHLRNILLAYLRHLVPHGLRRRSPLHSAVLLQCRQEPDEWTEQDGAWMWALQDAAVLHGVRCGAYITLTRSGWQVFGESRHGRVPHADSWSQRIVTTVRELPSRAPVAALAPSPDSVRPRPALLPGTAEAYVAVN